MEAGSVMRVTLVTADPDETAADAIRRMLEKNVGSVIVCEGTVPVGIFTERDVLRLAGSGADFGSLVLRETMTPNPLTISVEDMIFEVAQLMSARKVRHLPVVEDGNLVGIVSVGDVLAFLGHRLWNTSDEAAYATAQALFDRKGEF